MGASKGFVIWSKRASWLGAFLVAVPMVLLLTNCGKPDSQIEDVYIPEVVTFAGDTIPLTDPDLREKLEKELWINMYWQSNTAQMIKKSGRWFPMIDSVLRKEGIPEDFKYLVAIESSFENVTSNRGAVGFWQLMEPTAREFGLRITEEVDERLDPLKSTVAATRLLKRGRNVLGHWSAVAASYNIGITGLKRVMASQYTDQYYDLIINPETGRYFFRALACKLIFSNPDKYGYGKLTSYLPYASKLQRVDSSIRDLAFWCRQQGFSYKCFRQVNPWVKTNHLTINDSTLFYEVQIPVGCKVYSSISPGVPLLMGDSSTPMHEAVFQNLINKKDMAALKASEPIDTTVADVHIVKSGESLSRIAAKYKLTNQQLLELNPDLSARKNHIEAGMRIVVKK